jgi:hypothetical protein
MHNQDDLLGAGPSFELFFASECLVSVIVGLPVEKAHNFIAIGESFKLVKLVLERLPRP